MKDLKEFIESKDFNSEMHAKAWERAKKHAIETGIDLSNVKKEAELLRLKIAEDEANK